MKENTTGERERVRAGVGGLTGPKRMSISARMTEAQMLTHS